MSMDFLQSIQDNLSRQQWPQGALYVVATPIGNLGDLSLRARMALAQADIVAAEDTRVSSALLDAWGLRTKWMPLHKHNEAASVDKIYELLEAGQRVALVSDAGAPGVSDPGAKLIAQIRQRGGRVIPIPGASAVITALMASGVTSDENPAFVFAGFAPSKEQARMIWLTSWLNTPAPIVFYESPHRIEACLKTLSALLNPEHFVTLARELTKRFEEVVTLPVGDLLAWVGEDKHRQQGEFVIIVHAPQIPVYEGLDSRVRKAVEHLLPHLSVRDLAKTVAQIFDVPKDEVYRYALSVQSQT